MTDPRPIDYVPANVAFLDILGWSELIKASARELGNNRQPELLRTMVGAMKAAGFPFMHPGQNPPSLGNGEPSISVFSDSIILSQDIVTADYAGMDFFWGAIDEIGKILLRHGFFVRGGITTGAMYHTGQIAMGPALLRAIELESKHADHPRIILDNWEGGDTALHIPQTLVGGSKVDRKLTRETDGGWKAIDVLRFGPELKWKLGAIWEEEQIAFLNEVRLHIIANLQAGHCEKVERKYIWFAEYFNEVAVEFDTDEIGV